MQAALADLREALIELERGDTLKLPDRSVAEPGTGNLEDRIGEFITSLDPGFRAQEISHRTLEACLGQLSRSRLFAVETGGSSYAQARYREVMRCCSDRRRAVCQRRCWISFPHTASQHSDAAW